MPQWASQGRRAFQGAAVAFLLAAPASAKATDDRWGLGYCPPPYPPPCVARLDGTLETAVSCGKDVEAYVASVFRYRECVSSETERAVREANRIIQSLKCAQGKGSCPVKPAAPVTVPR